MEIENIVTHLIMLLFGSLVTLGGAVVSFMKHKRESDVSAGQDIREELRAELREVKEERQRLHEEREADRIDMMKDRQNHAAALQLERERHENILSGQRKTIAEERAEYQAERSKLKLALDKRDARIERLEARVAELENISSADDMPGIWD